MSKRNHSKSRSPVQRDPCRMSQASTTAASSQPDSRDPCRMSQASTIAASSQPQSLSQAPAPAFADPPDARSPVEPQTPGALEDITTLSQASSHVQSGGPTYCGARLSQLLRRFQGLLRLSLFRMLTPLRVLALPPLNLVWLLLFCPIRDRHLLRLCFLLSVMVTTGAASALAEASPPSPGLMRHVTHQHAGSSVDEATCSLFAAIERVTCTAPGCGGLRRMGAPDLQSVRAGQSGQAPQSG